MEREGENPTEDSDELRKKLTAIHESERAPDLAISKLPPQDGMPFEEFVDFHPTTPRGYTVLRKGRMTIPREDVVRLGLKDGDLIYWDIPSPEQMGKR